MALFGFGKKKGEDKKENSCAAMQGKGPCCVETEAGNPDAACACGGTGCNIKVLGAGCKTCHDQYENVREAVKAMRLSADVEYITDMEKVMEYGVMSMPAIVVNENVVTMGKVLKPEEVEVLLKKLGC